MTSTTETIEGMPAWATRRETNGDGSGSWWERDLTKHATAGTIDGTLEGIARLVLCDGVTYATDELTEEEFASPATPRLWATRRGRHTSQTLSAQSQCASTVPSAVK